MNTANESSIFLELPVGSYEGSIEYPGYSDSNGNVKMSATGVTTDNNIQGRIATRHWAILEVEARPDSRDTQKDSFLAEVTTVMRAIETQYRRLFTGIEYPVLLSFAHAGSNCFTNTSVHIAGKSSVGLMPAIERVGLDGSWREVHHHRVDVPLSRTDYRYFDFPSNGLEIREIIEMLTEVRDGIEKTVGYNNLSPEVRVNLAIDEAVALHKRRGLNLFEERRERILLETLQRTRIIHPSFRPGGRIARLLDQKCAKVSLTAPTPHSPLSSPQA